jgi:hypothetical protein
MVWLVPRSYRPESAPATLPNNKPVPAPTAAPLLPPNAAPAAAPTAVPITALLIVDSCDVLPGDFPPNWHIA